MVFEKNIKKKKMNRRTIQLAIITFVSFYEIRLFIFEYYSPERKKKKKIKIENISAAVCMCFHARVGHLKSLIAFF